jgi:enoyl-CoA hydratase/carnithine racemase
LRKPIGFAKASSANHDGARVFVTADISNVSIGSADATLLIGDLAMSDRVLCTITNGVADVRMNRPGKINALDGAMFSALVEIGEALKTDTSVRAVVLSGEGRGFCAGLDFGSFQAMAGGGADRVLPTTGDPDDPSKMPGKITHQGQQACWVWQEIPVPVIAAVHGVALGGGCQIALGADMRYVTADAQFSVLEIRWGLIPDMTGTQMLPRLVGLDVAKDLTFSGRMVRGEEAVAIGLATRVCANPREDALAAAHEIAAKSPEAIRGAKALLNMAGQVSIAEGFAAERKGIRALIGSPNQVEAVTAFFEKRPATYSDAQ